jgi:uncharacterized membrane protein (DUF373 family)
MWLRKFLKIVNEFEKLIILVLVILMGIIVFFSTIELIIFVFKQIYMAAIKPEFLLDKKELMKIFSLFFNVLISLELFDTVRLYLKEDVFHAEYILLVALIAITRKVIILEYENINVWIIMAIAFLIFTLALGYFLLRTGKSKPLKTENYAS